MQPICRLYRHGMYFSPDVLNHVQNGDYTRCSVTVSHAYYRRTYVYGRVLINVCGLVYVRTCMNRQCALTTSCRTCIPMDRAEAGTRMARCMWEARKYMHACAVEVRVHVRTLRTERDLKAAIVVQSCRWPGAAAPRFIRRMCPLHVCRRSVVVQTTTHVARAAAPRLVIWLGACSYPARCTRSDPSAIRDPSAHS
jgi:hypothetical protein